MRLAMRVEAAMLMGNGIWKVRAAVVERTLWAARWVDDIHDAARVRISKARNSARTMTRPGRASRIIGPQLRREAREKPPQQSRPRMKYT
jgi:hypothetical protein